MRRVSVLLAILISVVVTAPAAAQSEGSPHGLRFADRSLLLTPDGLANGVKVVVLNDTTNPLSGSLLLSDLGLMSSGTGPTPVSTEATIHVPTRPIAVAPAGQRTIDLTAVALDVADGEYSGYLVVYDKATGIVDRIPVTLQVGTPVGAVAPAVESLSVHAYAGRADSGSVDVELPLDVRQGIPKLEAQTPVGVLGGPEGGAVVTIADGNLSDLADGFKTARLTVTGIEGHGTYTGNVDFTPGESGGSFDLQVEVKDWPALVVVCLAFGIALAFLLRHWKGVGRPGLKLLLDHAEMQKKEGAAEAEFKAAAKGRDWGDLNVSEVFAKEAHDAQTAIEHLGRTSFDELDEDERKELVKRVQRLEEVGPTLKRLAPVLHRLEDDLADVKKLERVTGAAGEQTPPVFYETAMKLLGKTEIKSLDGLNVLLDKATKADDFAVRWPLVHGETVRALARIEEAAKTAGHEDMPIVAEARRKLVGAWLLLTEAGSVDAVIDRDLLENLYEALALAAETAGIVSSPEATKDAAPTETENVADDMPASLLLPPLPTFEGVVAALPTAIRPRIAMLTRTIRFWDGVQFAVAAGLTFYSGLLAMYWSDATFGGWQDYVAAFLWGSIGATVLDALAQALRTLIAPIRRV